MVFERKEEVEGPVQMSTQCYWNASTDGQIVIQYEENPNMSVIVTLFGCALWMKKEYICIYVLYVWYIYVYMCTSIYTL